MVEQSKTIDGTLIAKVSTFWGPPEYFKTPEDTFLQWLMNAFTLWNEGKRSSAFAPFNAYFASQLDFRDAFAAFVDREVREQIVGKSPAVNLVRKALSDMMIQAIDDVEVHLLRESGVAEDRRIASNDPRLLNDFLIDLFRLLLDLGGDAAFEWAARATWSEDGFATKRMRSGYPAPLALFLEVASDDTGSEARSDFVKALFDWCRRNSDLADVGPFLFGILLLRLRSTVGIDRAASAIAIIDSMFEQPSEEAPSLFVVLERVFLEESVTLQEDVFSMRSRELLSSTDEDVRRRVQVFNDEKKRTWSSSSVLCECFPRELLPEDRCTRDAPPLSAEDEPGSMLSKILTTTADGDAGEINV